MLAEIMELIELLKSLLKNKMTLGIFALLGLIIGLGIYFMPAKYIATGTFYVKRAVEINNPVFTYEGYYAQQTALSHTNTVAALLESQDIQRKALESIGVSANETNLYKYARKIKVKKAGPQLVTLTVKENDEGHATELWEALAKETVATNDKLIINGDNKLNITMVSDTPVVNKAYKSLAINLPIGLLAGLFLGVFLISIKNYD